jgi:hypothetical protein
MRCNHEIHLPQCQSNIQVMEAVFGRFVFQGEGLLLQVDFGKAWIRSKWNLTQILIYR